MTDRQLVSGKPVPADNSHTKLKPNGQQQDYVVLTPEERAKGFIKPLRYSYIHLTCGLSTRMGVAIAETYARNPNFYHGTFCTHCGEHFPLIQFRWPDGEPMHPPLQAAWVAEQIQQVEARRLARIRELRKGLRSLVRDLKEAGENAGLDPHHAAFAAWLTAEMPAGTVIGDPAHWAPRILRAVERLVLTEDVGG